MKTCPTLASGPDGGCHAFGGSIALTSPFLEKEHGRSLVQLDVLAGLA